MTALDLAAIRERLKAARDMVSALCQPRNSLGSREWSMSIPARLDYDPDLIIAAALADNAALLSELDRLQAEREELKSANTFMAAAEEENDRLRRAYLAERQRAETAEAEREADKEELEAYRSSVLYDAMMEGAKHKGWNRSSLDRALRITERRLHAARTKEEKND